MTIKTSDTPETVNASAAPVIRDVTNPDQPVTGRGGFAVGIVQDNAVSVESVFLAEDGQVLRFPAVFPNREYALQQVEELRQLVNHYFDQLAQQAQK